MSVACHASTSVGTRFSAHLALFLVMALAGWRAFDGPSSAAGLSDTRICAGGLAGFLTGWPGLPRFASGSTDQRMWRTIDRAIADSSRDFAPFAPHLRRRPGPPQIAEEDARGLGSAAFSPFYCDKNPDGERPAFWKTGLRALAGSGLWIWDGRC